MFKQKTKKETQFKRNLNEKNLIGKTNKTSVKVSIGRNDSEMRRVKKS